MVKGLPTEWGKCSRTVSSHNFTHALSFWSSTIAVGSMTGDIIILDAITGNQTTVLSGCAGSVNSLVFSSDGKLLVSGDNQYIKLWDMQTGGVIKTFHNHALSVCSVSISADCTSIASASGGWIIFLWDIQTGECHKAIKQMAGVTHVSFSPKAPEYLLSICRNKVWQWDLNGHKVGPTYDGSYVAFSPDATQFVSCHEKAVTVQNPSSGVIVAKFHIPEGDTHCCCFSPDGRLVAVAADNIAYVWDITSSKPHLIEIFIGHTKPIFSLAFFSLSSLVSASVDQSVRFWQVGIPSTHLVEASPMSTSPISATIKSITLQVECGIAITSNSDGVIKVWDISTGLCKVSYQTPAKNFHKGDIQMINGRLIFVWYGDERVNVWDCEEGELLSTIYEFPAIKDLRISGDGSRVFCLIEGSVQAWSVETGKFVTEARLEHPLFEGYLHVDGLRIWACCSLELEEPKRSEESEVQELEGSEKSTEIRIFFGSGESEVSFRSEESMRSGFLLEENQSIPNEPGEPEEPEEFVACQGWDFGILELPPVKLPDEPMPHPNSTLLWDASQSRVRDMITGKVIFQLPGRFGKLSHIQLNSHYLAACCSSGGVLILDFSNVLS